MIARSLVRAPAFAATAILTLALGIGLSTAVFTIADALLLRSLPVRAQNDLVTLWAAKRDGSIDHWPLGVSDVREFTVRSRAFQNVAFVDYYGAIPVPILDGGVVTRLRRALVSGNYFDVLGARAVVGRTLRPSDDVVGAAPVVVINHATWQRQFGGDPHVIGKRITLQVDGVAYTIVGVVPKGLEYPAGVDFWAPYAPTRLRTAKDSSFAMLDLVGRLAPGATPANAETELTRYLIRADASAWSRDLRGTAHSFPRVILGNARSAVLVVAAAAVLLLLITCINVANLLLVRGLARVREIAVRSALGATRLQVVAHLLAENSLLALVGGALGVLVAAAGVHGFLNFATVGVPLVDTVRLDTTALAGAFGITTFAMLLFGLAPALVTARVDIQNVLRAGTRQSAGRRSRLAREVLVGIQVALAVLVLSAAALIGRSFMRLQSANLAFESSHLLVAELGLRSDVYDSLDKQLTMLRALLQQVHAIPGVRNVSPVVAVPFSGVDGWSGHATADGQTVEDAAKSPMLNMELVTPDYFETFGLRVVRGRSIADTDRRGAEPVVVISESVARHYWPGQDPIGKRLRMGDDVKRLTVVGVVPDTRYRDLREARPSVYFPLAQSFFPFAPTTLAIRTTASAETIIPAIRRMIAETAPGVSLASAAPFETYMHAPLAQPKLNAFLMVVFAMAATVLAAVGLFGAMATLVRQRTHEMGIRMALGATTQDVQFIVVGRGLTIASTGVVAGMTAAFVVNRLLSSLLYDVSPTDPTTLAGVGALLIAVALAAAFVPAMSSGRIDPAVALRAEG
jgi:putative ABC transport system permease protein